MLTLAGAKRIAAAALREAHRLQAPGAAIATTDDGGNLLYLERLDGTFAMAATVSTGKARTAALFQKPTRGMKVDAAGNLFACGPGGLYVFAPDGALLGVLHTGVAMSNCAFGADQRTLFMTADHAVLAIRW